MPGVGIVELFQIGLQSGCGQFCLFHGHDRGDLLGQDSGASTDAGPQFEKVLVGLQFEQFSRHGSQDFVCHQVAVAGAAANRRIGDELIFPYLQAVAPVTHEQLQRRVVSLVEEEDVHRKVQLQVGWIVSFAVQNEYALGRITQRIRCTAYRERHAVEGGDPGLGRKVLIMYSFTASSSATESCEKFGQLRVVEKTGVDGHRSLVAAGKGEMLGVRPIKLHLRAEAEVEHRGRVIGLIACAFANGYNVRHQMFGDLPALLASISRACFAGQDVDDYLPFQRQLTFVVYMLPLTSGATGALPRRIEGLALSRRHRMPGTEVGTRRLDAIRAGCHDSSKDTASPAFCFCGGFNFDCFSWDCVGDEDCPAILVAAKGFAAGGHVCQFDHHNRLHR